MATGSGASSATTARTNGPMLSRSITRSATSPHVRTPKANKLRGSMFLHRSRVPLDQAPIDRVTRREWADRQGDLFDELEDGDPDGCSPWTCRSGLPVNAPPASTTDSSSA